MTNITISQKEIEEKICKLKVKKATGPDGVSASLLKYVGMSIAPSLMSVFKKSVEACKPQDHRRGTSTEQLLIHLTERWIEAVERKLLWEYCLRISLKLSTQCRTMYYYKS